MKKETMYEVKTNLRGIRNLELIDILIRNMCIINEEKYSLDFYPKSDKIRLKVSSLNKQITRDKAIENILSLLKKQLYKEGLSFNKDNFNVVTRLNKGIYYYTVSDIYSVYHIIKGKKVKGIELNKYQTVVKSKLAKWFIHLYADIFNLLEGKAVLGIETNGKEGSIYVIFRADVFSKIEKSPKLNKIWFNHDYIFDFKIKDNIINIKNIGDVNLDDYCFDDLMCIPEFNNIIYAIGNAANL